MNFVPKKIEEELGILFYDFIFNKKEFKKTKVYMKPLIKQVVSRTDFKGNIKSLIIENLIKQIDVAAEKYIVNLNLDKKYKFSTYFTWYISEEIKKMDVK